MIFSNLFSKEEPVAHRATRKDIQDLRSDIDAYLRPHQRGLLFEDDKTDAMCAKRLFNSMTDMEITVANTTVLAGENILSNRLAFILSDVRVTVDSGIDVVYEYWKEDKVHCPVFFYSSGEISFNEEKKIEEMGAMFFSKGLGLNQLKTVVEIVLKQARVVV